MRYEKVYWMTKKNNNPVYNWFRTTVPILMHLLVHVGIQNLINVLIILESSFETFAKWALVDWLS